MKKFYFAAIALVFCSIATAKIWRVNNMPGVTADFTTVQAAHDGAASGDTIHLEPSVKDYGAIGAMSKRLTIISTGNFLSVNPGNQYSPTPGTMTSVSISNALASNSVFHCNFSGGINISSNVNGIRIERCYIAGSISLSQSSNNIILNNYVNYISLSSNSNLNIISNNIIESFLDVNSGCSATITNNVIFSQSAAINRQMHNSTLQNNIINKNGGWLFTNCVVENNIASNALLPAGNGNVNSVNMATIFVNPNGTDDASFVLQTSSPNAAIGAGTQGVDCGAYGGTTPFKRGLQPAIPAIYKLTAPASPVGNSMNVIFSTKSNN